MKKKKQKINIISQEVSLLHEEIDVITQANMKEYSDYVNLDRAVPCFYDGLKPVHRRLMYAAFKLRSSGLVTTAKIGGDAFGDYHPHGSPEASMKTLIVTNVPTMHGEGNWGNLIDKAAASRYTKCKLSGFGEMFFQSNYIVKDVTTFVPNYNDTTVEPLSLPAPLPNVLLNGGEGIGVAIATAIPTFTAESIVEVLTRLLNKEKLSTQDIYRILKLDLVWGGKLQKSKENNIRYFDLIRTGTVRGLIFEANLDVNEKSKSIVISEWPSGLNPERFVEKVRNLPETLRVDLIEGILTYRIEMGKGYNSVQFNNYVQKIRKLATTRQSYNINVTIRDLVGEDIQTKVVNLSVVQVLMLWLKERVKIEKKSLLFRQARSKEQIAYSKLLIYAISKLDIIMEALKQKDPDSYLMKHMKINEDQAKSILELRVRQLSSLDKVKVQERKEKQKEELAEIEKSLKDPRPDLIKSFNDALQQIKRDKQILEKITTEEITIK